MLLGASVPTDEGYQAIVVTKDSAPESGRDVAADLEEDP